MCDTVLCTFVYNQYKSAKLETKSENKSEEVSVELIYSLNVIGLY